MPINPTPPHDPVAELIQGSSVEIARREVILNMPNEQLLRELWTNRASRKVYRVTAVADDADRGRVVEFTKLDSEPGTGGYSLSLLRFAAKYSVATRDDVVRLATPPQVDGEEESTEPVGFVVEPDCRHDFSRIVLWPDTVTSIKVGMNKVVKRDAIERVFQLSRVEPRTRRSVLNFFGPPGTGKTLSAVAVAHELRKKLYQVDYSAIISKYVGDTAKHIKMAFDEARRLDAVLFWDEADALLSRRVGMAENGDRSFATSVNQNRTVLMQELDRFDGVVIMSTNLFRNYDEAFVRRIAQHVEFKIPSPEMRRQLFDIHMPAQDRVAVLNWPVVIEQTDGLSGGDILNVVINTISRVTLSDDETTWIIRDADLIHEATAIKSAKQHNTANTRR